jgi:hypothetical protein
MLTVKTTKSNNMGLLAEAVGDASLIMGYLKSPSSTPVAYRRGCGQFSGKPLAVGEKWFHPSLSSVAAMVGRDAGKK